MSTTWIVIANASLARIYAASNLRNMSSLQSIEEFTHPESREKGIDLVTDRPGSYTSGGPNFDRFVERTSPKQVEFEHFAQQLAKYLEQNLNNNQYEGLILAASPHFLGLLRNQLSKELLNKITLSIDKDLTHLSQQELTEKLKTEQEETA